MREVSLIGPVCVGAGNFEEGHREGAVEARVCLDLVKSGGVPLIKAQDALTPEER
jgi:hypothetical protein